MADKWAWFWESERNAGDTDENDVFDSAEDALKNAAADIEPGYLRMVGVGRCVFLDPAALMDEVVDTTLVDVLQEGIENYAQQEELGPELTVFEMKDADAARRDLTPLLREWARKHIKNDHVYHVPKYTLYAIYRDMETGELRIEKQETKQAAANR